MLPYLDLFGLTLPTYGIFVSLGMLLGVAFVVFCCRKNHIELYKCIITATFSLCVGFFGAKVLSVLTLYSPSRIAQLFVEDPIRLFTDSGLVFFGGLVFAVPFGLIAARLLRLDLKECEDVLTSAISLGHAFGRVGCFFAGCCYGCESEFLGVVYKNSESFAPIGVSLFPIQLVEAIFELFLFAFLVIIGKRFHGARLCLPLYLVMYPTFRFFAEFFRGDEIRGICMGLSTSQWISIIVGIAGGIILFFRLKRKNQLT